MANFKLKLKLPTINTSLTKSHLSYLKYSRYFIAVKSRQTTTVAGHQLNGMKNILFGFRVESLERKKKDQHFWLWSIHPFG